RSQNGADRRGGCRAAGCIDSHLPRPIGLAARDGVRELLALARPQLAARDLLVELSLKRYLERAVDTRVLEPAAADRHSASWCKPPSRRRLAVVIAARGSRPRWRRYPGP